MRTRMLRILASAMFAVGIPLDNRAAASPWAEVGDAQLRSDVEVLAAAGLIDDVTTQWPLPWGGVLYRLEHADALDDQPDYVRAAAERLEQLGKDATAAGRVNYAVTSDFTNLPDVVRGFDTLGHEDMQSQVTAEWMGEDTSVRLQVGAQSLNRYDHQALLLDGSQAMQRIGNAVVYAGYITHWWGPGWDTALSLSNNARPFPQLGITRIDTTPFSSHWLSWIGPWQAEFFVGVLDGSRLARNTLLNGLRVSANPIPGLELALARTEQSCGTNQPPTAYFNGIHPCKPIAEFLNVRNGAAHTSSSKDETNFDIRYTNTFGRITYALYTQMMDRDTGPFVHSDTSHLFGFSVWIPVQQTAVRLTAEYADTITTKNFFSFNDDFYGQTYWDYKYQDGWQYRDRTLGSSLDTDSRLASVRASWAGSRGWTYTLTYYRAWISSPNTPLVDSPVTAAGANRVTAAPVVIDIGEARVRFPFDRLSVDLAARLQDDQPRPDRGFMATGEIALTYRL